MKIIYNIVIFIENNLIKKLYYFLIQKLFKEYNSNNKIIHLF